VLNLPTDRRIVFVRRAFGAQLVAGLAMFAFGLFIVPTLPHAMMDVVLTPEQLRDVAKSGETLALLEHSVPLYMIAWICAGLFVSVTSVFGYHLLNRLDCDVERNTAT
jgi:hypothetical protein